LEAAEGRGERDHLCGIAVEGRRRVRRYDLAGRRQVLEREYRRVHAEHVVGRIRRGAAHQSARVVLIAEAYLAKIAAEVQPVLIDLIAAGGAAFGRIGSVMGRAFHFHPAADDDAIVQGL
jgi:hypothetical protein